jgi:hypothetical protein
MYGHGMKFRHGELAHTLATMKKDQSMGKVAIRMETYDLHASSVLTADCNTITFHETDPINVLFELALEHLLHQGS